VPKAKTHKWRGVLKALELCARRCDAASAATQHTRDSAATAATTQRTRCTRRQIKKCIDRQHFSTSAQARQISVRVCVCLVIIMSVLADHSTIMFPSIGGSPLHAVGSTTTPRGLPTAAPTVMVRGRADATMKPLTMGGLLMIYLDGTATPQTTMVAQPDHSHQPGRPANALEHHKASVTACRYLLLNSKRWR